MIETPEQMRKRKQRESESEDLDNLVMVGALASIMLPSVVETPSFSSDPSPSMESSGGGNDFSSAFDGGASGGGGASGDF